MSNASEFNNAVSNYLGESGLVESARQAKTRTTEAQGAEDLGLGLPGGAALLRTAFNDAGVARLIGRGADAVESELEPNLARAFRVGRNVVGRIVRGSEFKAEKALVDRVQPNAEGTSAQGPTETSQGIEMQTFSQSEGAPVAEPAAETEPAVADEADLLPAGAGGRVDLSNASVENGVVRSNPDVASSTDPALNEGITAPRVAGDLPQVSTLDTDVADAASTAISTARDTVTGAVDQVTSSAGKAVTSTLGQLTEDSLVDDDNPIGGIITVGLGLATAFSAFGEGIKSLFDHHNANTIAPPAVSFQAGVQ